MNKLKKQSEIFALQESAQKGFSLVELLIAMTIGLFLLAGIASSYLSSKASSIKREQVSSLEDNGRFALEILTKVIKHTGYSPVNAGILPKRFILNSADVVNDSCRDGSKNILPSDTNIFKVTSDSSNGDSLGVIYQGDNNVFTDCQGNELQGNELQGDELNVRCRLKAPPQNNDFSDASRIYNSFFVNSASATLRCAGSRSSAQQVIAEGIENIQFMYGLDTDNDGVVERYVNASNVGTLWNNVISIQIAVLARSMKPLKQQAEVKTYHLLDTTVTTPSDRYKRAVFSTTIQLRNTL